MKSFSTQAALLALSVSTVQAIPPESFGFPSAPNDTALTVTFNHNGNKTIVGEAELFGYDIVARQPTLAVNTPAYRSLAEYTGTYMVLMVDPDAKTPQNPSERFYLHWAQPNLAVASAANSMGVPTGQQQLMNTSAALVPFVRPSPGATSDPHRYIVYAFEQPSKMFTVPESFSGLSAMNRSKFDLTEFISQAKLGKPAAAEFFFVSHKDGVPTDFIARPGGMYPGGNGAAVTAGPGPTASSTSSMGGSSSSTAMAMATSAASSAASSSSASSSSAASIRGVAGFASLFGLLGTVVSCFI
ncbi:MAG: hypothetical protein M1828_000191 [Chrysothrix sp. TS-e1954]|nr:MAG: hypothetical protein M1828_000191 [Chrysothrix sp. TS-e1954]